MKKLSFLLFALCISTGAFAWGQKGHDVTACIAEHHLTAKAAKALDKVLDGHSLVYYANWLDQASHTPAYAYTSTWHYFDIDPGKTVETMECPAKGDVLKAVTDIVAELKKGGLSHDEEALRVKMLIHLVGDMHQPMHTGHTDDLGGNRHAVLFFSTRTNLHSVWDSRLVEMAHKWSYSEWENQIDRATPAQQSEIEAGTPDQWLEQSNAIANQIYDETPVGTKIEFNYIDKYTPVIEQQFLRGGLRLAELLNEIYK